MKYVKDLLHELFSEDAILSAAYCEQCEDISYCNKHGLYGKKADVQWSKAKMHGDRDGDKTYNRKNILEFRKRAQALMEKNKTSLYDKASEIEHFAIRRFFYDDY